MFVCSKQEVHFMPLQPFGEHRIYNLALRMWILNNINAIIHPGKTLCTVLLYIVTNLDEWRVLSLRG